MNYTKDIKELRRQFSNSVSLIKDLIDNALAKDYADPLREEYAKSIAVKLRILLVDGAYKSLITQLGISEKILFHPMCVDFSDMPGNLIQTFGLAGEYCDNQKAYFFSNYSKNKPS